MALFGGPLNGFAPLKYIYLDEAGTSAREPVSVVLAVIIDADTQWRLAFSKLAEIISTNVPEILRPNFVSHAKTIFGERRADQLEIWGRDERVDYLKAVMALLRQLNLPIALGIQRRGAVQYTSASNLSPAQHDHVWAFLFCIAQANKYMHDKICEGEVATAIAEDVDSVRTSIRAIVRYFKQNPTVVQRSALRPTRAEQSGELSITRIVDGVHFVSKQDGPLLQITDACAFGFRRFFAKQMFGNEFVRAIFGSDFPNVDDWDGPGTGQAFMWRG